MNILVSNISTLPKPDSRTNTILERVYSIQTHAACEVESIKAVHTNESVVKCLAEMKDVKESGGIHKIVALVSYASLNEVNGLFGTTAYEYFKQHAIDLFEPDPQFITVQLEIEKNKLRPMSDIMSELCANIGEKDRVYIDVAGGRRTENNIIQLLTKILKYKGIETPYSLYSDINVGNRILDTADFDKMMALSDAFNEFMTTGKSDQLKGCFDNPSPEVEALLDAMCNFSDHIRLGNVDDLDVAIVNLQKCIRVCDSFVNANDIETILLKQFLPVIKTKLLSDDDGGSVDYCKIVQWCLNNGLIQQALTVFVEKIPIYVFDKQIIWCKNGIENEKESFKNNKKPQQTSWYADVLYTQLLYHWNIVEHKNLYDEFRNCLVNCKPGNSKQVCNALDLAIEFEENFDGVMKSEEKRFEPIIQEIAKLKKIRNYQELFDELKRNPCSLAGLFLDLSGTNAFDQKLKVIAAIEKGDNFYNNYKFRWNCAPNIMAKLLYGYVYVKSFRNQTNHALSDETLSEANKQVLAEQGYDFQDNKVETIKKNVNKALKAVEKAAKLSQKKLKYFKSQKGMKS